MRRTSLAAVRLTMGLFVIVGLLARSTHVAYAHEEHEPTVPLPQRLDVNTIYAPTPLPDRIILTWTGDPARSQAVTWRTDTSVTRGFAEIAEAEAGPKFAAKAERIAADKEHFESVAGPAHYHWLNFTDLKPGTKYAYRLGDGVNWTEWFQFATASDKPEPFAFIYFGDAQNDIRMHWSRVVREAFSDAPKARFMIHAGDLVNHGDEDSEWGEWFHAGGWINTMIPSVCSPGNHEYPRDHEESESRHLSRHWRPQFALPTNGPPGLEETVYWVDVQGVRVISLNSSEAQDRQVEWLDKTLAENPNRWTVVTFHHPIYSTKKERDNPELRRMWKPLFDNYRVDLVLQGHDHSYARMGFDVPSEIVGTENEPVGATAESPESGTVYVVSVSGPKLYEVDRQPFMKRAGEGVQLYQIIHVDGDRLRYEARTAIGDVYDAFTLVKSAGGRNQLIDQAPATPESLPSRQEATAGAQ